MKYVILAVVAIVALIIVIRLIAHHRAIRHGRCPICGAKIEPLVNGNLTGWQCTECEWLEATDQYGNVY